MKKAKPQAEMEVRKLSEFSDVIFGSSLARQSTWADRIMPIVNNPELLLVFPANDTYVVMQLRQAAKKLRVQLLFGRSGDKLVVKAITISESQKRLHLLLREPRSLQTLRDARIPDLSVDSECALLSERGLASARRTCGSLRRRDSSYWDEDIHRHGILGARAEPPNTVDKPSAGV